MKQDTSTLEYTVERHPVISIPESNISHIRYMFQEIDQLYLEHKPSAFYYIAKRVVDIAIASLFVLLVLSWLTPLLAILIKLSSRGPVFFVQKRTGLYGAEFNCFKFRTMYVNDEADIRQVSINDGRITTIGKFLRITHLDETAQFLNVLIGDMSIVGPRPHMVYHTQCYSECIPYYNLRLEVKPGMTGMAQIKDYIGEINGERELRKRIQWDIYYMKNRSMLLDIQILITTGQKVFQKAFSVFATEKKGKTPGDNPTKYAN
jgi:putative colanic acid biosynthesis UDP-glucose lipid carrier transferase